MAKYYIQSGTLQAILDSDSADKAALWAVHRVMAQICPIYECDNLSYEEKEAEATIQSMLTLDETIRVSEQGFNCQYALKFDTQETVMEWHQLMIAFEKLQRLL